MERVKKVIEYLVQVVLLQVTCYIYYFHLFLPPLNVHYDTSVSGFMGIY